MNRPTIKLAAIAAALMASAAVAPFLAATPAAAKPLPSCAGLAAYVTATAGADLNKSPVDPGGTGISSTTPVVAHVVAAGGGNLSYCQVIFQIEPAMTIEVGLPLSTADGGTGGVGGGCGNIAPGGGGYYGSTGAVNNTCVEGNWNGKFQAIGNGGFAGVVPGVTEATNLGFVGSSTDNGHSTNWCNAINPKTGVANSIPNCDTLAPLEFAPIAGGFVLTPDNKLHPGRVTDFIDTSEVKQIVWGKALAAKYYGQQPKYSYWNGCSTGGRQGFQMAQFHPDLLDGILVGSAVMQWNRFIPGSIWFPIVLADVDPTDCPTGAAQGCNPTDMIEIGPSAAFNNAFVAATNMAVAECDANDGVADGVINEPRLCNFKAESMIGTTVSPMTSPMTEAQAKAIDLMWDGPRNQRGQRLWGGISKGTPVTANTNYGEELAAQTPLYWVYYKDPSFNIVSSITTTNFSSYFQLNDRMYADTVPPPPQFVVPAATDIANLDEMNAHGAKLIAWSGQADGLVVPFRNWNYDTRLLEKYGVAHLQKFYRSFYYPGNGHCGGNTGFPNAGLANSGDMFNALIDWVENKNAPNSITAYVSASYTVGTTNARLICPYPATAVYNGSGPTLSSAPGSNYTCVYPPNNTEDPELAAYDQTAKQYYEAP